MHLGNITSNRRRPRAFTLVEVLVATTLLGLLAASSIWALTQANNYASISRLYTGAETVAQNRIDYLLSDAPFNPQSGELGSTNEWAVGGAVQAGVVIYTEPSGTAGQTHAVLGTVTTTVKSNPVVTKGQDLNLYSATVLVTYTFRGKSYSVQLNAMRASDV